MLGFDDRHGRIGIAGLDKGIAEFLEHCTDQHAHGRVVLDDQHGFARIGERQQRRVYCGIGDDLADKARQEQAHSGALAHFAVNRDMPTGLAGEAVDHRQAQTGALADGLGGEEGVEHAAHYALRNAAAGVADAQFHVIAGAEGAVGRGEYAVQMAVGGLDGELAAVGHGIARVDHQVEQGAFQLVGVGFGGPQLIGEAHLQGDAFVDAALQQFAHGADQAVDLHRFRVQRLAPGKRQQAVGETRSPVGRGHAQVDQTVEVVELAASDAPAQQLQAADNSGEHVVEVVSDTPRQLADGFHLLGLAQGLFVTAQLGGAFFDLLLKGFEGALQACLAFAQVDQPISRFILPTPTAQRGADQADQGHGMERPLQESHVAQQAAQVRGTVLFAAAVVGHQHDGQVGPGGLLMQIRQQRVQILAVQGFGGYQEQAGTVAQFFTQDRQAAGNDAAVAGFVEHHQGQRAVAAHRRKDNGALGER